MILSYNCAYKLKALPRGPSSYIGKKISIAGGREGFFCGLECPAPCREVLLSSVGTFPEVRLNLAPIPVAVPQTHQG